MQHQRQDTRELLRLLEPSACICGAEDEVVLAGEEAWDAEQAAFPGEMLVGGEGLDGGLEGHAFFYQV